MTVFIDTSYVSGPGRADALLSVREIEPYVAGGHMHLKPEGHHGLSVLVVGEGIGLGTLFHARALHVADARFRGDYHADVPRQHQGDVARAVLDGPAQAGSPYAYQVHVDIAGVVRGVQGHRCRVRAAQVERHVARVERGGHPLERGHVTTQVRVHVAEVGVDVQRSEVEAAHIECPVAPAEPR